MVRIEDVLVEFDVLVLVYCYFEMFSLILRRDLSPDWRSASTVLISMRSTCLGFLSITRGLNPMTAMVPKM